MNAATVADKVIACDISPLALKNVEDNAKLNGFKNVETLQGDVFEVLRNFRKEKRTFDTVILDPRSAKPLMRLRTPTAGTKT